MRKDQAQHREKLLQHDDSETWEALSQRVCASSVSAFFSDSSG